MILIGNQRGGARDLALHLMKDENDHVHIHEIRGFASDDLLGAFTETYAVSRGTRCKQFLFSLSLNPPQKEQVSTETFETAIEQAEERLGLSGQPRAIVFHEKEGRRHAHAVWSRIDVDNMKAVQLSFTRKKLMRLSRELHLEHGWQMPRGLADYSKRDPRNFTLAEWQQAKRIEQDPRDIKAAIQDAWAISDTKATFEHALGERGFRLARGDKRGFVAVDTNGEVFSIPKSANVKTRLVRDRLGEEAKLLGVAETKDRIAREMLHKISGFQRELSEQAARDKQRFLERRDRLVDQQRAERQRLGERLETRRLEETRQRQSRFRVGFKGIWDRLRGEQKRIQLENEREAEAAEIRDKTQRDEQTFRYLNQRQMLRDQAQRTRSEFQQRRSNLRGDVQKFEVMLCTSKEQKKENFRKTGSSTEKNGSYAR